MTVPLADAGEPSEAIRSLRALVEAAEARSVLVVGVDADAAAVGAPLAAALARSGHPTVLVDADLQRGSESSGPIAAPDDAGGLAAWLTAPGPDEGAVARLPVRPTDLPGLSLLPAGHALPGAVDVLDGPRLGLLVPALLARAERVVAVAPPLARAADALPLARRVDGVVLVVAAGRTTRSDALHARDTLRAAGGRVLGVVFGGD